MLEGSNGNSGLAVLAAITTYNFLATAYLGYWLSAVLQLASCCGPPYSFTLLCRSCLPSPAQEFTIDAPGVIGLLCYTALGRRHFTRGA